MTGPTPPNAAAIAPYFGADIIRAIYLHADITGFLANSLRGAPPISQSPCSPLFRLC